GFPPRNHASRTPLLLSPCLNSSTSVSRPRPDVPAEPPGQRCVTPIATGAGYDEPANSRRRHRLSPWGTSWIHDLGNGTAPRIYSVAYVRLDCVEFERSPRPVRRWVARRGRLAERRGGLPE